MEKNLRIRCASARSQSARIDRRRRRDAAAFRFLPLPPPTIRPPVSPASWTRFFLSIFFCLPSFFFWFIHFIIFIFAEYRLASAERGDSCRCRAPLPVVKEKENPVTRLPMMVTEFYRVFFWFWLRFPRNPARPSGHTCHRLERNQ